MGRLRTQIMIEDQPRLGLPPTMSNVGDQYPAVRQIVEDRLRQAAAELAERRFVGQTLAAGDGPGSAHITVQAVELTGVTLPWQRLFDLTFDVVLRYDEH